MIIVREDRLVGDRGYEGDSGYLPHLGSTARTDRWAGATTGAAGDAVTDAAAGVARRLQARLERHLWLLERLQAEPLLPELPGLPELHDTARGMRRDAESLLLLCGAEPGVRPGGPRRFAEVLADTAATAEEPRRVEVRPGPAALVAPGAAVELGHVLAELVDHATAVHPGARVALLGRLEEVPGGVGRGATVDVIVDGAGRHDPDGLGGRRAAAAAEQLARRSRHGIVLRRPPGPPAGSGLVASVHCPSSAITVEAVPVEAPAREPMQPAGVPGGGFAAYGAPNGRANGAPNGGANGVPNGGLTGATNGAAPGVAPGAEPANAAARSTPSFEEAPAYSPSPSSRIDELFGPLLDLPLEPMDDRYATPIFEAIASAWFREDAAGAEPGGSDRASLDWQSPQDDEWREAAARAARTEPAAGTPTTSTGLPRRRPGDQLVPPPRSTGQDGQNGVPPERVPDRIRDRLSTYQRGLREGRHRAEGVEGPEPDGW